MQLTPACNIQRIRAVNSIPSVIFVIKDQVCTSMWRQTVEEKHAEQSIIMDS